MWANFVNWFNTSFNWPSVWAYIRINLLSDMIRKQIVNLVAKLALGSTGGLPLIMGKYLANWLIKRGFAELKDFTIEKQVSNEVAKRKEEYKKVITSEGASADEKKQAAKKLLED